MTEDEKDRQALLTSPQVQADNHAFAAILARSCGTAGPKEYRHDDARNGVVIPFPLHGSDEANH